MKVGILELGSGHILSDFTYKCLLSDWQLELPIWIADVYDREKINIGEIN